MDEILGVVDRFDQAVVLPPLRVTIDLSLYDHIKCFDRDLRRLLGDWPFTNDGRLAIEATPMDNLQKRIFLRQVATALEKRLRAAVSNREELEAQVTLWKREWIERFDREREVEAADTLLQCFHIELQLLPPSKDEKEMPHYLEKDRALEQRLARLTNGVGYKAFRWVPFFDNDDE